jgi:hypothetical protein
VRAGILVLPLGAALKLVGNLGTFNSVGYAYHTRPRRRPVRSREAVRNAPHQVTPGAPNWGNVHIRRARTRDQEAVRPSAGAKSRRRTSASLDTCSTLAPHDHGKIAHTGRSRRSRSWVVGHARLYMR